MTASAPASWPPTREAITGLVLCGGAGSRMGGVEKGLLALDGRALVDHALRRLAPQVGSLAINANAHGESYAQRGVPVWADTVAGRPGPLAGWLTGLTHATTPWLASVPCDSPRLPADLVARLASALQAGDELALACTPGSDGRAVRQPVFALLHTSLRGALAAALAAGERKVGAFAASRRVVWVEFPDAAAFANANTPAELAALATAPGAGA